MTKAEVTIRGMVMAIVRCPTCGSRLELEDRYLGREVDCGECRAAFIARPEGPTFDLRRDEDDDRPRHRDLDDENDRPRRRSRYDDEDDDYDRPLRRRRSRRRDMDDLEDGAAAVKGPAIALIVASATGLVWWAADLAIALFAPNLLQAPPGFGNNPAFQPQQIANGAMIGDPIKMGLSLIALLGAVQMLRLRSYGFAMTAAIMSLVPCVGCCLLNFPFGIWALVVLCNPAVRRAFELTASGRGF